MELGRVAMDLLCQEMRDACWVSSESLGFRLFTAVTVPVKFSLEGCDNEWDVVRDKKSTEEA